VLDFIWVIVEDLFHSNNIMPIKKASFFSGVSEKKKTDKIYFLLKSCLILGSCCIDGIHHSICVICDPIFICTNCGD
jgi:hypothetical protein